MSEELYTERVYIDPERLLRLKKQRRSFKLVPSIFQPPPEIPSTPHYTTPPLSLGPSTIVASQQDGRVQALESQMLAKTRSPNVDFILSLLGEAKTEQIVKLQEGDCLNMQSQERWLVLEGEVRITGVGSRTFGLGQGALLFVCAETKQKVREVICMRGAKLLKLSETIFEGLRNYIFLKNAEKIKYLKYCPFFIWSDHLSEDLAACMSLTVFERGQSIYSRGDPADLIFFVKEGVVLLQRFSSVSNQILREYEAHYECSQISESEITLVVKKGMVFGIDGILLKDSQSKLQRQGDNPEETLNRQSSRVYSARTLGRTEVYVLQRQILEGLFDVADLLSASNFPRQLTKNDLQRICSDYAEMVVRHRSLPKIAQGIASKQLTLSRDMTSIQEMLDKKSKVRQVRQQQKLTRKHSIANIISDTKGVRRKELNNSFLLQYHFSQKLGISEFAEQGAAQGLPRLSSHFKKRRLMKDDVKGQTAEKYIMRWFKGDDPIQKEKQVQKVLLAKQKKEKLSLINIKSYRSIVPNLI